MVDYPNCLFLAIKLINRANQKFTTVTLFLDNHVLHPFMLQAPVDSPDRFFVEVLFSNGANYDPTTVTPLHDNHVLPTKPRRPLTNAPGVTLQMLQELLGRYAKGKNTASNYQLQVWQHTV